MYYVYYIHVRRYNIRIKTKTYLFELCCCCRCMKCNINIFTKDEHHMSLWSVMIFYYYNNRFNYFKTKAKSVRAPHGPEPMTTVISLRTTPLLYLSKNLLDLTYNNIVKILYNVYRSCTPIRYGIFEPVFSYT